MSQSEPNKAVSNALEQLSHTSPSLEAVTLHFNNFDTDCPKLVAGIAAIEITARSLGWRYCYIWVKKVPRNNNEGVRGVLCVGIQGHFDKLYPREAAELGNSGNQFIDSELYPWLITDRNLIRATIADGKTWERRLATRKSRLYGNDVAPDWSVSPQRAELAKQQIRQTIELVIARYDLGATAVVEFDHFDRLGLDSMEVRVIIRKG